MFLLSHYTKISKQLPVTIHVVFIAFCFLSACRLKPESAKQRVRSEATNLVLNLRRSSASDSKINVCLQPGMSGPSPPGDKSGGQQGTPWLGCDRWHPGVPGPCLCYPCLSDSATDFYVISFCVHVCHMCMR